LQEGGRPIAKEAIANIPIPEGITLDQISEIISKQTPFEKEDIEEKLDEDKFIDRLQSKFPQLLTSAVEEEETLHPLEGYLFPGTYEYYEGMSMEDVLTAMIKKTDDIMRPYYDDIEEQDRTVHEVLTIASFIEREGIDYEDRTKIASVFYNRLEAGMPLQTDVSVTYALGVHKE